MLVFQCCISWCAVALQVQGIGDDTDSIGDIIGDSIGDGIERNMDLLQAFVKSLLMASQGTAR